METYNSTLSLVDELSRSCFSWANFIVPQYLWSHRSFTISVASPEKQDNICTPKLKGQSLDPYFSQNLSELLPRNSPVNIIDTAPGMCPIMQPLYITFSIVSVACSFFVMPTLQAYFQWTQSIPVLYEKIFRLSI